MPNSRVDGVGGGRLAGGAERGRGAGGAGTPTRHLGPRPAAADGGDPAAHGGVPAEPAPGAAAGAAAAAAAAGAPGAAEHRWGVKAMSLQMSRRRRADTTGGQSSSWN